MMNNKFKLLPFLLCFTDLVLISLGSALVDVNTWQYKDSKQQNLTYINCCIFTLRFFID